MSRREDFVGLRDMLEAEAHQPAFAVIRARRRNRNHGQVALVSLAIGILLLAVGTAVAGGRVDRSLPPGTTATPDPTSTDFVDPGHLYFRSNLESLAGAPTGALYALGNSCRPVDFRCDPAKGRHQVLVSGDLAASWTVMGEAPFGGRLLVADDARLWIVGSVYHLEAAGANGVAPVAVTAAGSADGGRTWRVWPLDDVSAGLPDEPSSDTVGGTIWISHGPRVYTASGVERPTPTPASPDANDIFRIIAIGPDHAVVQGLTDFFSPTLWFETTDRGAHWTRTADPCAGTPHAGSYQSSMAVAGDGTRWATCVADDGVSGAPGGSAAMAGSAGVAGTPREIVVSTDGGRTWQRRGALTDPASGQGLVLYPISATVAWHTDTGGHDVMRTVDGRSWRSVDHLAPGGYAVSFVAIDADTAVYTRESTNSTIPVIAVTRDGGQAWTTHQVPAPPA